MRETDAIRARYSRRRKSADARYDPRNPYVRATQDELFRAVARMLGLVSSSPMQSLRVLEIGCGYGSNLSRLVDIGLDAHRLVGVDLLEDRVDRARDLLPTGVSLEVGDATCMTFEVEFDVVMAFTVFSSVLSPEFQQELADAMTGYLRPGGCALIYDFVVDNPRNRDVAGVPPRRVRDLFGALDVVSGVRLTLAPPLGRRLGLLTPWAYPTLSAIPLLRTHALTLLRKTDAIGRGGDAE